MGYGLVRIKINIFLLEKCMVLLRKDGVKLINVIIFKVDPKIIEKAKELLIRLKLLQSNKWFAGIHLRTSKDKEF